jgi:hypothetical protein
LSLPQGGVVTNDPPAQRHVLRNNQIAVRLHCRVGEEWHRIEAQQWNARGFCFFHAFPLPVGVMPFKRSLQHFDAELVWSRACHDEAQVTEMLLNEAIHRQADRFQAQPEMQQRLMRLMRVQGMVDAKQRVLASLGSLPEPGVWQMQVQKRMQEALFQSGVRVDSAAWRTVVEDALTLGGVVQDLERWSGSLAGDGSV